MQGIYRNTYLPDFLFCCKKNGGKHNPKKIKIYLIPLWIALNSKLYYWKQTQT